MDSRTALFACAVLFAAIAVHAAPQDKAPAASAPAAAPAAAPSADDKYTTKYDNLDIDQVLASKRLVNQYVQCLLDKKPCTADAAELRKVLPEALKTQCAKCNPKQKNTAIKVVERLQKDYNTEWKQLLDKWDSKREYLQSFQKFMDEEKKKGFKHF